MTSLDVGLRNLFREGVNLEIMSAENIIEEMGVDGITAESDAKIKYYTGKRRSWKAAAALSGQVNH